MNNNNFAKNLKRLMLEHDDSPVDLVRKLRRASIALTGNQMSYNGHKVSATWLRQLVQDHTQTPSVQLLEAIAELYGVESWELLAPAENRVFPKHWAFGFYRLKK